MSKTAFFRSLSTLLVWAASYRSMSAVEQFDAEELRELREELRQCGLDSFQAGTLLTSFLAAKGYGVSTDEARHAVTRIEGASFALPRLREELERLAFVM